MSATIAHARAALPWVAQQLFASHPETHSVGIGFVEDELGFVAEHQGQRARPLRAGPAPRLEGWPIAWRRAGQRAAPLSWRARTGTLGTRASLPHPEQRRTRPLSCGLEVQNIDADHRAGVLPSGYVGTLGCWVRTAAGEVAMLSNAHVLADSGRGLVGHDRILQAGCTAFQAQHHVAVLGAYLPLLSCAPGTPWGHPSAVLNVADAAVAPLLPGELYAPGFLSHRRVPAPRGTGTATLGEPVFKVGRTTGLTRGHVDRVNVLYSVPYEHGDCWFEDLFSVVTSDGSDFADGGDSGSAVLRPDGTVLGLLFAGASLGVLCSDIGAV